MALYKYAYYYYYYYYYYFPLSFSHSQIMWICGSVVLPTSLRPTSRLCFVRTEACLTSVTRLMPDFQHSVSVANEWAELQARTNGRYRKMEFDPIRMDERQRRTYGNRERYFYASYGVLTEFLRMNVILTYFATETATATDTECWKSGITVRGLYERRNCKKNKPDTSKRHSDILPCRLVSFSVLISLISYGDHSVKPVALVV